MYELPVFVRLDKHRQLTSGLAKNRLTVGSISFGFFTNLLSGLDVIYGAYGLLYCTVFFQCTFGSKLDVFQMPVLRQADTLAAIAMRPLTIFILTLVFAACSSKQPDKTVGSKVDLIKSSLVTDSCLNKLYIDRHSVETTTFKNLWTSAEKSGYTFNDDTIVPFVKIVFQPNSARFYNDTLKISSCDIFDSVNIHKMKIQSSKPIDKDYYPNLNVEEWQFKNLSAALDYANALTDYYNKGYGLKSPTAVLLTNQSVYIFETAAYKFIPEMERMEKLLEPKAKVYVTNY